MSASGPRGTLDERPFPKLLVYLDHAGTTGTVEITDEGGDASTIYLRRGIPVHVDRPDAVDRLDKVLIDSGSIPRKQLMIAEAKRAESSRRLGEVLTELGFLDTTKLLEALNVQLRRKLVRLYFPKRGSYVISPDDHDYGIGIGSASIKVPGPTTVLAGIRAAYDERRLDQGLAHLTGKILYLAPVAEAILQSLGFTVADAGILATLRDRGVLLDGPQSGFHGTEAKTILLALDCLELLQVTQASSAHVLTRSAETGAAQVTYQRLTPPPGSDRTPTPAPRTATLHGTPVPAAATLRGTPAPELLSKGPSSGRITPAPAGSTSQRIPIVRATTPAPRSDPRDAAAGRTSGVHRVPVDSGAKAAPPRSESSSEQMARTPTPITPLPKASSSSERMFRTPTPTPTMIPVAKDPTVLFQAGELFLKNGNFSRAEEAFASAVKAEPSDPVYKAMLAWTRFWNPGGSRDEAAAEVLKACHEAVKIKPTFARGFFFLGQVFKYKGDHKQAEQAYRKALKIDPALVDAERELRVIEMRRSR